VPELWLPYGRLEVMAEVRDAQILRVLAPSPRPLEGGLLSGARCVALLEEGQGALAALRQARAGMRAYVPRGAQLARRICEEGGLELAELRWAKASFGGMSYARPLVEEGCVLINSFRPDPLYGYSSVGARLLRQEGGVPEGALERLERGPSLQAAPAEEAARALAEALQGLEVVEVVEGGAGPLGAFRGGALEAYLQARRLLHEAAFFTVDVRPRMVLASCGGHPWDRDAFEGLAALWNFAGALEQGAQVVLLCEAAEGLGSPAWEEALLSGPPARGYFKGAEHMALLRWLSGRATVILVSALPEALARRLGLRSARSLSDALGLLGPRARFYIVPYAACTVLSAS